jgi:hypothetical protein
MRTLRAVRGELKKIPRGIGGCFLLAVTVFVVAKIHSNHNSPRLEDGVKNAAIIALNESGSLWGLIVSIAISTFLITQESVEQSFFRSVQALGGLRRTLLIKSLATLVLVFGWTAFLGLFVFLDQSSSNSLGPIVTSTQRFPDLIWRFLIVSIAFTAFGIVICRLSPNVFVTVPIAFVSYVVPFSFISDSWTWLTPSRWFANVMNFDPRFEGIHYLGASSPGVASKTELTISVLLLLCGGFIAFSLALRKKF